MAAGSIATAKMALPHSLFNYPFEGSFSVCKNCHCEPVTDVTGVAIRSLKSSELSSKLQCLGCGFPEGELPQRGKRSHPGVRSLCSLRLTLTVSGDRSLTCPRIYLSVISQEKQRQGAGAGMGTDHRAGVADEYLPNAATLLQNLLQLLGILQTIAMADKSGVRSRQQPLQTR